MIIKGESGRIKRYSRKKIGDNEGGWLDGIFRHFGLFSVLDHQEIMNIIYNYGNNSVSGV